MHSGLGSQGPGADLRISAAARVALPLLGVLCLLLVAWMAARPNHHQFSTAQVAYGPSPSPSPGFAPPPPDSPPGAYTTPVATGTYSSANGLELSGGSGQATVHLSVPPGALPDGTTITIYAGNASVLAPLVPPPDQYVDSFAVSWSAPDGSSPQASSPLTLTVSDAAVRTLAHIYRAHASSLQGMAASVSAGSWSVQFTTDPGFVAGQSAPKNPPSGRSATGPSGPDWRGGLLALAAALAVTIGAVPPLARRRRRVERPRRR